MNSDNGTISAQAFNGRVAVVTGAASGIGRGCALRLADLGASVACLDLDLPGALRTRDQVNERGGRALAVECDVSSAADVTTKIDEVIGRLGKIDILVNCAGITGKTGMKSPDVDLDDFDRIVSVNLRGAFLLTRAVLPAMSDRHYGRILHVASIAGKEGNPGMVGYSASKAGLIGMVKCIGKEYAEAGITVNALAPAVILTPLLEGMPDSQVKYMTDKIPMRRAGTVSEVSDMVAWCVSESASFTTGFTFDLSGGRATY